MGMAAAMFSFAGCQENEIDGGAALNGEGSTFEIVAGIDQDATKTTLTDKDVEWEEGDVIYVVTSEGPWGRPYQEDNAGTSIAEYTYADGKFTSSATIVNGEYEFLAMYTNQKSYHRQDASSHKLAKEQSQNCADPTAHIKANDALVGAFSAEIPMDAPAEVTMKHLYTMMQVDIMNNTGAAVEIKKFEMKAAGADLAGVFYVEDFYDAVITTKQDPSETVAVNVTGGSVASGDSLPVYFVMAPISGYTGDVTFKVTDASGNTYSKTVAMTDITFEAGKYNTTPYAISTPDKVEAKELPFEESFDSSLGEFTKEEQLPEGLTYVWSHDATHKYAKASAYVSGTRYEQTSYLVSPVLDLTNVENAKVQFDHTGNYFNGTETTSANLCIREVGGDWETIEIPTYWSQNWAWVNSGDIDISKFAGKLIQIGFRYSSTEEIAGTWEVKNVSVTAQAAATELIVSPDEMTVDATGGVASVTYSIVNPKAGKSISATADVDWIESFDYSTSGQIKFNVAANETTDVRTGVVTISYEGAVSVPVAIAQKGKVAADTEEVTIDLTAQGYANGAEVASVSEGQVTVTFDKGTNSNSPKFYTTGSAVRVYGGNLFTVSISSGSIVGIELTYGTGEGTNAITTDLGNFETSIWSGYAQSVTFTVGGTTGHRRIQKIKVLYKNDGSIPEPAVLTSIAVENPKTEYTVGDAFEKPTVKATYDDASIVAVTGATFTGYDMTTAGEQTVTVSYTEGEVTATTTYDITVSPAERLVEDGTYVIAVKEEGVYYAASTEANGTRRGYVELSGYSSGNYVSHDSKIVWTITNKESGITVSSGNQYWKAVNNGISLVESANASAIKVANSTTDGAYFLSGDCGNDGIRYLAKNVTYGFGFYAESNKEDIYLIPATFVALPDLDAPVVAAELNGDETGIDVSWTAVDNATSYVVSCTNQDDVTVTSGTQCSFTDLAAGTYTISVTAKAENYNSATSEAVSVTVPSAGGGESAVTLIIDGATLTSTATTEDSDHNFDGITLTMSKGAKSLKSGAATNAFSKNAAIMIGKNGAYIYNKTPIPGRITKFEIYSNAGASAKVSVGVNFSSNKISQYDAAASNTYKATLSNLNSVYDCSDNLPDDAHYFWYQVTNANNSQVQFRITYIPEN